MVSSRISLFSSLVSSTSYALARFYVFSEMKYGLIITELDDMVYIYFSRGKHIRA